MKEGEPTQLNSRELWIKINVGMKKGRVYGLCSQYSTYERGQSSLSRFAPSQVPQQVIN